jgi:hypothetical protein
VLVDLWVVPWKTNQVLLLIRIEIYFSAACISSSSWLSASFWRYWLLGVQEFCASILYLVVLCQFLISDARWDSFEMPRACSRSQRGHFLDKSQK